VCVPAAHAVPLPAAASFADGVCLGVPALTAHRCVHADGLVEGTTVLVTGGAGAVGRYAVQFAALAGATAIATASTPEKQAIALGAGAHHVVDRFAPDAAAAVRDLAGPSGVARVVDVAFGANLPLVDAVVAPNATVATYGSDADPAPRLPFYSLMRRGITIRTVLVFTMPAAALASAVEEVSGLLASGRLTHAVGGTFPLDDVVAAHRAVEYGTHPGRVLLRIDGSPA
jgi:NADPH:quinone reductase